jgi:hypothetical protein
LKAREKSLLLKMLKTLLTNILPLFAAVVRNPTHPKNLSYSFNNQRNQSLHTPKSLEFKNLKKNHPKSSER